MPVLCSKVLRALIDRVWAGDAAEHKPLLVARHATRTTASATRRRRDGNDCRLQANDAGFATNLNLTLQLQYVDAPAAF